MTSGQKTAFSLLITVSLFAALVVASFLGLFSFIDKKIYEPTKTTQLKNELNQISTAGDEYILNFLSEFGFEKGYMSFSEISLYLNRSRSDGTAKTLSDINGNLFFNNPGLKGIRIIDVNGKSIHFSTFEKDLLKKDSSKNLVAYKNYDELVTSSGTKELPYEVVKANDFKNKNVICLCAYYGASGYYGLFVMTSPKIWIHCSIIISVIKKYTFISGNKGVKQWLITQLTFTIQ